MVKEIDMLGGLIVLVSDQQKALEFFSQKLGFEIKENQEDGEGRWIEVRPKNSGAPISLVNPDTAEMSAEKRNRLKRRLVQLQVFGFMQKISMQRIKH